MWWLLLSCLYSGILLAMHESELFEPVDLFENEKPKTSALIAMLRSSFEKKETPLHWKETTLNDIDQLISRDIAKVNSQDEQGNTPLHKAIEFGDIVKAMLFINECAADVNAVNNQEQTPLHYAFIYNNFIIAQVLLGRSVDRNKRDINNKTPPDYASAGSLLAKQFGVKDAELAYWETDLS